MSFRTLFPTNKVFAIFVAYIFLFVNVGLSGCGGGSSL